MPAVLVHLLLEWNTYLQFLKKSFLGPGEIASFSGWDLSRHNKHDSFWLVALTGYLYILFFWVIVFSDFLSLEIHKHLVLPS